MASHLHTPATVLDAPVLTPVAVDVSHEMVDVRHGDHSHQKRRPMPYTGDVEEQFTGRTVGLSRKGRKIRRPSTRTA